MLEFMFPFLLLNLINTIECREVNLVVGGKNADIKQFPHAAFVKLDCKIVVNCGASILTDKIVLTAAHCLDDCNKFSIIFISVGHVHVAKGAVSSVSMYLRHKRYDKYEITNDVALMRLKTPLRFSSKVKRVALMENPPKSQKVQIAGWGWTDEEKGKVSEILQYVTAPMYTRPDCQNAIGHYLPKGTICTISEDGISYASKGDSGSALMARGYIQIGVVSYRVSYNKSVVVYTDTSYFFRWIKRNARKLKCN